MKKEISVKVKVEYEDGKLVRDEVIINQTYHHTLSNGIECVTQGGLITIPTEYAETLAKKLLEVVPTKTDKQTEI